MIDKKRIYFKIISYTRTHVHTYARKEFDIDRHSAEKL